MAAKKTPPKGIPKTTPNAGTSTDSKKIRIEAGRGKDALGGSEEIERMSFAPTVSSEISASFEDTMPSPPGGQPLPSEPKIQKLYGDVGSASDTQKTGEMPAEVSEELKSRSRTPKPEQGAPQAAVTPPGTKTELKSYAQGDGQTGINQSIEKRKEKIYKIIGAGIAAGIVALTVTGAGIIINHCNSCRSKSGGPDISKELKEKLADKHVTPESLYWTRQKKVPIAPGDVVGRDGEPIHEDDIEGLIEFMIYPYMPPLSKEQAMFLLRHGDPSEEGAMDPEEREKYVVSKLLGILKSTDSSAKARLAGRILAEMHPLEKIDDIVQLINKGDFKWEKEAGIALLGIVEYQRSDPANFRYDRMPFFASLLRKDETGMTLVSAETYSAALIGIGLTNGNRVQKLKEAIAEDYCDTCGFPDTYKYSVDRGRRKVHPAVIGLLEASARGERNVDSVLAEYLESKNTELRGDAAWALGQFVHDPTKVNEPLLANGAEVEQALVAGLGDDDHSVREECARSLGKLKLMGSAGALIEAAGADPDEGVRRAAAKSVKQITGMDLVDAVEKLAAPADASTDVLADAEAVGGAADVPPEPEAEALPVDLGEQEIEGEVGKEKSPKKKNKKRKKKKKPKFFQIVGTKSDGSKVNYKKKKKK